jgi:pimeloyl-ACP methyl ester carboxylesterase
MSKSGRGCLCSVPAGSFASYADDISQLMHQLNVQSATHIGTSGGGPYACACAAMNTKTTAGLGLIASMTHCSGPGSRQLLQGMHWFDRVGYNMIANAPQLVAFGLVLGAPFMAAAAALARLLQGGESWSSSSSGSGSEKGMPGAMNPAPAGAMQEQQQQQGFLSMLTGFAGRITLQLAGAFMHPADRQMLQQQPAAFTRLLPSMLADSVAQSSRGLFHDMRLTTQPWRIDLRRIEAPALVLQGEADVNVTVAQAKWLAAQIRGAKLRLFPHKTHFSLVGKHAHDILGMVKSELMERS